MDKNPIVSDNDILPKEGEMTELIMVRVTPFEKEFFQMLTTILSGLNIDEKGNKVIKNNSLSDFVRMSLSVASNFYLSTIFLDSHIIKKLKNHQTKKEFIAFRKKYMNISIEFLT
jgi:hypothetical protein